MAVRSIILPVHRWFGLIAGLFLIVLGVTGSLLVFEDAIDRAFNPVTSFVRPGATRLGVDSLMVAAKSAWPGHVITGVRIPERTDLSLEFSTASGRGLFIDPHTAQQVLPA